jgi:hypothetical protein
MQTIHKPASYYIDYILGKTVFFLKMRLSLRQEKRDKGEDKKLQKKKDLDGSRFMMKDMLDIEMLIRQFKFINLFLPS